MAEIPLTGQMPQRPIRRQAPEPIATSHLDWQAAFFGGLSDIAIGTYAVIKERERVEQFETARRDLQSAYNVYNQDLDKNPLQADTGKDEEGPVPKFRKDMGTAYEAISKRVTNGAASREFDSWAADQKVRWSNEVISRASNTTGEIRKATTDKIHADILATEFTGQDPTELKDARDELEANIVTLRGEGVLTPSEDTRYQLVLQKGLKQLDYNWWRERADTVAKSLGYGEEGIEAATNIVYGSNLEMDDKRAILYDLQFFKQKFEQQVEAEHEKTYRDAMTKIDEGNLAPEEARTLPIGENSRKKIGDALTASQKPAETEPETYLKVTKQILESQTSPMKARAMPGVLEKARYVDKQLSQEDYLNLKGQLVAKIPPETALGMTEAFDYGSSIPRWYYPKESRTAYYTALWSWLNGKRKEQDGKIIYDVKPEEILTESRELAVLARSGALNTLTSYGLQRFLGPKIEVEKQKTQNPGYKIPVGEPYVMPDGRTMGTYNKDGTIKLSQEGMTIFFEEMVKGDWKNPEDVKRAKEMAKNIGFQLE